MRRLLLVAALLLSGCVEFEEPSASQTASERLEPMHYEPVQCRGNPWQRGSDTYSERSPQEAAAIVAHYEGQGVRLRNVRFEDQHEFVCDACHCPRGDWVRASVATADAATARNLGWQYD
jgi:hypothetical protein